MRHVRPVGEVSDEEISDEQIIRRVQQGEVKLFSLIFERYYSRLYRFVRHLGVPAAELEDVLADAFARAFARVHQFDPTHGSRYSAYLYTLTRNLVTDRLRERGRSPELAELDEARQLPEESIPGPLERVLRLEEVERIRRALERMGPTDREIITLSYDRELSCREIMQVMGKPSITSVTTHLYKAMRRLRELVLSEDASVDASGVKRAKGAAGYPRDSRAARN